MQSRRALYLSLAVILVHWTIFAARHLLRAQVMPANVREIAFSASMHAVIAFGVVWALLRWNDETLSDLGFKIDGSSRDVLLLAAQSIGLFVVSNLVINGLLSAVMGGGFAEELERAFVLTRFEKLFGRAGLLAGLILSSIFFGLGHLYQGKGGAISAGLTGLLLALIFLRRRRVVDAMVVHGVFDLLGIAAAYALYAQRG
jgi:membrane protease YdiL (CAAX protease family)